MDKPVVRYSHLFHVPEIGGRAALVPIDHPRTHLNGQCAYTSCVDFYDEATGRLETINTTYLPE